MRIFRSRLSPCAMNHRLRSSVWQDESSQGRIRESIEPTLVLDFAAIGRDAGNVGGGIRGIVRLVETIPDRRAFPRCFTVNGQSDLSRARQAAGGEGPPRAIRLDE